DRPLLAEARADVMRGKYQALIAYATDRLSRDPIHLAIIADECARAGAQLIFVTEPLDASEEGALIRYVKGYASKIEREKIRERNMRGKHATVRNGNVPTWGLPLYGYRSARKRDEVTGQERGVRVIYEPEAEIVRRIFRMVTEDGVGLQEVARRLNREGVPSP